MSKLNDGFVEECRFIPDSKDDPKAFVKVATIVNESERIVRVVAKGIYAVTIETMYCEKGRYQWHTETISLGIDEVIAIGKAVNTYYVKETEQQEKEEHDEEMEKAIPYVDEMEEVKRKEEK